MKTYVVLTEPAAAQEMDAAHRSIAAYVSYESADRWLDSVLKAADTLASLPTRCPRAVESNDCDETIYQLLVGRRPHVYRVLYAVRVETVHIVHIRHSARRPMSAEELRIPPIDLDSAPESS